MSAERHRDLGELLGRLSIQYNRRRLTVITTEPVKIISGAEVL